MISQWIGGAMVLVGAVWWCRIGAKVMGGWKPFLKQLAKIVGVCAVVVLAEWLILKAPF